MILSRLLHRFALLVLRHKRAVLISLLLATTVLAIGATRIFVEVDPDRELPQEHPYVRAFEEVHQSFGDKNLLIIGLRPKGGTIFTTPFLRQVKLISDRIAKLPGIVTPLLQSLAAPSAVTSYLTPDGFAVQQVMPSPPLTKDTLSELRRRVLSEPWMTGTIVSYDHAAVAIYATFELTPQLPGYVNIYRAVRSILDADADGGYKYYLSGPIAIVASLTLYASRALYFFPLALLIIGLIHYEAFRSLQAVFLPLLTGLLAVTWALGFMGFLGVPLDPFNSTTPVLILAIGAGHAVQILKRYYEALDDLGDNDAAIVASIESVGPVTVLASLIAAASFASLATLGTDSMRTFGLFTALGILSVLVIELTLIPALRALLAFPHRPVRHHSGRLDSVLTLIAEMLGRPNIAKLVLLVYVLMAAASVLLSAQIEVDTSFKRNFRSSDTIRRDDDVLNHLFAGTNGLFLTIEGRHEGSILEPEAIRAISSLQREVAHLPGVGKVISIVDILQQLDRTIGGSIGSGDLALSRDLATQYLFLYSLAPGNNLSTYLTADNRMTKMVVMLHEDSTKFGAWIITRVRELASQYLPKSYRLHIAGPIASNYALTQTMVAGKIWNIVQVCAITLLFSWLAFRSILVAMIVILPLTIAVLGDFAVMGAFGINLDVSTAAVVAMTVGIGADYAVYFLSRVREEFAASGEPISAVRGALLTSGKAVWFVSTAVAFGYAVLCLSGFRLFIQLGILVGLAMLTASVATLVLVPALLILLADTRWASGVLGPRGLEQLGPQGRAGFASRAAGR